MGECPGDAPVSGVGKAAFVQVLDCGEDILSFSDEQNMEGTAEGGGVGG
jgi:hypothetical protein